MWDLLIGPVSKVVDDIVDKLVPDKNAAEKAKQELTAQLQTAVLAAEQSQLDIDKTEAASPSVFVSGWRPGVAWVCVWVRLAVRPTTLHFVRTQYLFNLQ